MSEDYKKTRAEINSMTAIEVIEKQIKYWQNPEDWIQEDRFTQGKISGLQQALRLIKKQTKK